MSTVTDSGPVRALEAAPATTGGAPAGAMPGRADHPELLRGRLTRDLDLAEARTSLTFSMLFWMAGLTADAALLLARDERITTTPLLVSIAIAVVGFFVAGGARMAEVRYLRRWYGATWLLLAALAVAAISVSLHAAHDAVPESAALYILPAALSAYSLRRPFALTVTALTCLTFLAVLLAENDIGVVTGLRWLVVALAVTTMSTVLGPQHGRAAEAGRAAEDARSALATVNAELEQRVATQVAEIERGRALRRFLSPEVADAVLGDDALLAPHRREVAVFFSDLRGFTAFTSRAEPEDVVRVVGEYYEAIGEILRRHGATIGGYAGDGIMAYVGDPLPVADPAGVALRMATEARDVGRVLSARWRDRGDDLGVGIGVALGHATLGVVGGADRRDYTALGSVVNLAARLCGEAADGEVLVDQRAAAGREVPLRGHVALKGFGEVAVHAVA